MDILTFIASLEKDNPPENISIYLLALWYEAKGDWNEAHITIQDVETKDAAWIHAYLHRKEGDTSNANYWYTRAGKKMPAVSLQEEWESIAATFIENDTSL